MFNWTYGIPNGWVALAAVAVFFGSFLLLGRTNPKNGIEKELGDKYVSTDSTFYRTEKAAAMFMLYKERGLFAAHRRFILLHDLIFPPCYCIPLVLLLAYLHPAAGRQYGWVMLAPLLAMVFDYSENFSILSVLSTVERTEQVPWATLRAAQVFTYLKLSLLIFSAISLAGFLVYHAVARLRGMLT